MSYASPDHTHSDLHLLRASRVALARLVTSPTESTFKFNPVLLLYRYHHETELGTSWDLFEGLVGVDSTKEQSRVKLLWFLSL